ncbi:MAG TPA: PKD domain-containing protein [Anaerohalosphaeraceae bacterium]|jgi:PKD repeat protein|nr:PKD domain-containing protein [Anaerohalosphaeraceae bacterium]HRT49835.1 PKD domain-containing protein [Anaerohalosphaeraceae bacterium]HRT87054.1 PKD domain-containing protein [Anaerohalosphaeraceae bacterium]
MKSESTILRITLCSLAVCCICCASAQGDVTIDNGEAGTSFTGTWEVSGGTSPYGADSLWARDGATYTWAFNSQPAGKYEVLMWWSAWPSRATAIDVTVTHANGVEPLVINQQVGAGQWNSLGQYYFQGSGSVTMTAANGATISSCADAVWFRFITANVPPVAQIISISPSPAQAGQTVQFAGGGTDGDGSIVAWNWSSSIDGHLSDAASFATSALSEGMHDITLEVQDNEGEWSAPAAAVLVIGTPPTEIIVDNRDTRTSATGIWELSGGPNPYGADSVFGRDGATFTWRFIPPQTGNYQVSMWWTEWSSRSTAAAVDIVHANGTDRVFVNQQIAGGQWNALGVYAFNAGIEGAVTIIAQDTSPTSYCADAVKFTFFEGNQTPTAVIDSIQPNPAGLGEMVAFVGHGEDLDGSIAAYRWESNIDGLLSSAASFTTDDLSQGTHQITFAVQDDAGQWSQPASQTLIVGGTPPTQVIIDNRDANTSATGTWEVSGAPNPYGADSVFSRDGATFTWHFTPPQTGNYQISMWWTEWSSRSTAAAVDIVHAGGTNRVLVNQQTAGGQWNTLGVYAFNAGVAGSVTIIAADTSPTSYCADAVKFTLLEGNQTPTAVIDFIQPNPAGLGETIAFVGHGEDLDGSIAAYRWESNIDGLLSTADSFTTDALSQGTHQITLTVRDDGGQWSQPVSQTLVIGAAPPLRIIIDNLDAATSATGTWELSGGPNPYGADSVFSRDGATFTWHFNPPQTGTYQVEMWWTEWPSRSTAAAVDIVHAGGTARVFVNQQTAGGQWNPLGAYSFNAGLEGSVTIIAADTTPTSYCADAVRFTLLQGNETPTAVIDSITPNPAKTGQTVTFTGHGSDSDGSIVAYRWESSIDGPLSNAASFSSALLSLGTHTITFAVQDNAGLWSTPVSKTLMVTTDAAPTAVIDSISPNPASVGQTVTFSGHGSDPDGSIVAYRWESSINGILSGAADFSSSTLSQGTHEITFTVQDNAGQWSAPVSRTLVISGIQPVQIIVDNRDSSTSSTGTWEVSGAPNPYGADSVFSRDGATFAWRFTPPQSGNYEVAMWWTEWPSRSTAAPVYIVHANGNDNVLVNQQVAGGRWNVLGVYPFSAGVEGGVVLWAQGTSPTSYCADAVRFTLQQGGNQAPVAVIDSITPNPAAIGQSVTFAGHGQDTDGSITAHRWESSIDGVLSTAAGFSTAALSQGTHTINFTVQDNGGQWSAPASQTLVIGSAPAVQIIVDNRDSSTTYTGTWQVSSSPNPYGADAVTSNNGAAFRWLFTPPQSGNYEVAMWWTQASSRSTAAPVYIVHADGYNNVSVNQRTGGGQWNTLGVYRFTAGVEGSVVLWARDPAPATYCADAVKVTLVQDNQPPVAVIDSITPNPAIIGQTVTFTGHGVDADGSIAAYRWESSISGVLSTSTSFSTATLSQGTHTITFTVQDNAGLWSQPVSQTLVIGGVPSTEVIVDNRDSATSSTGTWEVSGASDPYGQDSVFGRDGATFTWYFTPAQSGSYEVAMWWTEWPSRSTAAPLTIVHAAGTENLTVNQQVNGGRWNVLGVYSFTAGVQGRVTLLAQDGAPTSYCADAVKFTLTQGNEIPVAVIDNITPNPAQLGQSISFTGHGTDSDGSIAAYRWVSDIDGQLSTAASFSTAAMSEGSHQITFTVQDNRGQWSQPAVRTLVIGGSQPGEIIIDNGDPETSYTGVWPPSGASGYYGEDSLYSRDGTTYTWTFTPPSTGLYEVSMWWTAWSSRTTNAQVTIAHADGTATVYINQQANASQWNRLGEYHYSAGNAYNVTITSASGTASTCADAVRFVKVTQAGPPAADFYADRVRGGAPFTVQFQDQSSGEVTQWQWDFGDEQYSTQRSPSHAYSKPGLHTVSLTVTGPHGTNKKTRYDYIDIKPSTTEHIYLVDCYGGNNYFIPDVAQMMRSLRAAETSDGWRYQPSNSNMTYYLHRVHSTDGLKKALREENAHVIITGHANFGFGSTFASSTEILNQRIDNIRYVDDDRFVNYSSDMVSTKIDGMKYGQAYPNWEPIFKDGRSALMPYDFGDPRGNPPYNYYLTYKVPGDPTVYKIELANGKWLERFPDASTPVWFSEDGSPPDPVKNPEYFIISRDPDYSRCEFIGSWPMQRVPGAGYLGQAGYLGYNYQVRWPGSGANKAIFTLVIEHPGLYRVLGSWYPSPNNASNARFTITHAEGTSVVYVDQRTTYLLNPIGTFNFDKGSCTVTLDDRADGQVVADAIVLDPLENPVEILTTDFTASRQSGPAGLSVDFTCHNAYYNMSNLFQGGPVKWHWDFGDGSDADTPNPTHVYNTPGVYTVRLTVTDLSGDVTSEVKTNFIAVGQTPPLKAQFAAIDRIGADRTVINFIDQSSGNITNWLWDFGDGKTSTERNPTHVYDKRGTYTVRLTVSGPGGSDTVTKTDYIYNVIGLIYADNTSVGKPHFYSRSGPIVFGKVICYTGDVKIQNEEMKYSRMFHSACNSFQYFAEAFNRGVLFAKTKDVLVEHDTAVPYLEYYLRGYTDRDILAYINSIEDIHEFYNFNEKPPSMRMK